MTTENLTAENLLEMKNKGTYTFMTPKEKIKKAVSLRKEVLKKKGLKSDEVIRNILPNTIADDEVIEDIVSVLMEGSSPFLFGPPGTGKTTAGRDVRMLFPKRDYVVADCPFQDNPLSLADKTVYNSSKPCPLCVSKYGDLKLLDIADFDPEKTDPSKIPVRMIKFREGRGLTRIQGARDVMPDYLSGTLKIGLLNKVTDPFSPETYAGGKLTYGNNGFGFFDEIAKLPEGSQNALLESFEEKMITPPLTKVSFPANMFVVATSNMEDLPNLIQPLNDRLESIYFGPCKDHEKNKKIMKTMLTDRKVYVDIDLQKNEMEENVVEKKRESVPLIPLMLFETGVKMSERYRSNLEMFSNQPEVGSNRSMRSAIERALIYTSMKTDDNKMDDVVDVGSLTRGIKSGMMSKMRASSMRQYEEFKQSVEKFLNNCNKILEEEARKHWCEFYHTLGTVAYDKALKLVRDLDSVSQSKRKAEGSDEKDRIPLSAIDELKTKNETFKNFYDYLLEKEKKSILGEIFDYDSMPEGIEKELVRTNVEIIRKYSGFKCGNARASRY